MTMPLKLVAEPGQKDPRPIKATSWLLSQSSHFLAQLPFPFLTMKMSFQSFKPTQHLSSLPAVSRAPLLKLPGALPTAAVVDLGCP